VDKRMDKRTEPTRRQPPRRLRRAFPGADLLIDLLEQSDTLRERQHLLDMKLDYLLAIGIDTDCDEDAEPVDVVGLQKGWNAFLREGGVSADDLRAYLRGECIGSARVKRHLRLVSNNPKPARCGRVINGHDAA
jgi:hypothetical protein